MHILEKIFLENVSKYKLHNNLYIAFSGGLDSSVLFHLCNKFLNYKHKVRIIHIDYSFSSFNNSWSFYCKNISDNNNIPIYLYKTNSLVIKNSEETFRIIRFKLFLNLIIKNSTFLLAHQLDDYIETFLFRLFRGVGPDRLFGFNNICKLYKLNIVRPLILANRSIIRDYAVLNGINHVCDFSNFSEKFDRNYIRHRLFNSIKIKWYKFDYQIFKFSLLFNKFFFYIYHRTLFFIRSKGFNINFLRIDYLLLLPSFIRINVIRFWLEINSVKKLYQKHYIEINSILLSKNKYSYSRFSFFFLKKIDNFLFLDNGKKIYFNNIFLLKKKKNVKFKIFFLNLDTYIFSEVMFKRCIFYNFYNKDIFFKTFLLKELF